MPAQCSQLMRRSNSQTPAFSRLRFLPASGATGAAGAAAAAGGAERAMELCWLVWRARECGEEEADGGRSCLLKEGKEGEKRKAQGGGLCL